MNPITNQQPPLQVQPPRPSFSCDRHPDDNFTGFCPSCLVERLAILDQSPTSASSSLHTSTRSIFKLPSTSSTSNATREANRNNLTKETTTIRSHQELRRTKSFSASYNESFGAFASVIEPQRKSCDVRGRNTLWSLFSSEDENKCSDSSAQQHTLASNCAVLQTNMEDEGEYEECKADDDDEIRVSEEQEVRYLNDLENDIIKMEAEIDAIVDNLKSVKAQLDLDEHSKKPSLPKFWSAASVLSKKWQKWKRKQAKNVASRDSVVSSRTLPVGKPNPRQCNETQSEIADQRFGRRSCDTETRFSLDAGRIAFDDTRHSLDDPRASWDGYVIGRSFPLLLPRVEDVPAVKVPRADMLIPLEEPAIPVDIPGGSIQTREYYLDSSSMRRKSLDGSTSIRRMAATVVAEMDGQKPSTSAVYNAKVSPATIDFSHIRGRSKFHSIGCEKELGRHSNSNSNSNSNSFGGDDCSFKGTTRLELMRNEINHNSLSYTAFGPRNLWPSVSNYVLTIVSPKSNHKSPVMFMYFLDSGGGSYPEVISSIQAEWFCNKSKEVNPNSSVPEIVFWHIPSKAYKKVAKKARLKHTQCVGSMFEEEVAAQEAEIGMMKLLKERPSIKAVFVGHNHGLDWCCPYEKMWLCYARHTGYGGYGSWARGARILEISDEPFSLKSWIRMENGSLHSEVVLST